MRIIEVIPQANGIITVVSEDGRIGEFDISPYLQYEAFEVLKSDSEFQKLKNGGYFIEWDCGADLSSDTIEAHWKIINYVSTQAQV